MIKPFERADEANDAVELGPKTYNRMVETLERVAALTVAPPLQISDSSEGSPAIISLASLPRPQPGLIVCFGPQGQPDYDDARYWVAFAKCSNNDNTLTSNLNFIPDGSGTIVTATDLFEFNAQSHNVSPGTPVILFPTSSQDGLKRWLFIAADETPNGQSCQGSGSGSDTSQCYCGAQYDYNCSTKVGTLTLLGVSCGNTFGIPGDGAWHVTANTGTTCTWKLAQPTGFFCDPTGSGSGGECATADGGALCSPGAFNPGAPTPQQIAACCTPQNECFCIYQYDYTCATNTGVIYNSITCGNNTGIVQLDTWILFAATSTQCKWIYVHDLGKQCVDGICLDSIGECPDPVPGSPLDPAPCCGSGSGSGSGSGATCWDLYTCLVTCGSGQSPVPAAVTYVVGASDCSSDLQNPIPHTPGVWYPVGTSSGDPAGSCRYNIVVLSTTTCDSPGECTSQTTTTPPQPPYSVYQNCCTQCTVPCCPSDTSQNYVLMCLAGVMQWVPAINGCPGSGS